MAKSAAFRRYNIRVIWMSAFYGVFLLGAAYAFKHHLLSGPPAYVAAILPALPIIGIFSAIGRYLLEEQDEYVRMLMVRQTLWASGFALSSGHASGYNVAFADGRYLYLLGIGFSGDSAQPRSKTQLLAAARALYRRVHGQRNSGD